jgi:casein kinase I family protein HRR25
MNQKYEILESIGSGNFGSVYKGKNKRTGEFVAVKIEPVTNEVNLLKHETTVYQYLNNIPGIPQVRWFGNDGKNYYMVLNLLGHSLETIKQRYGQLSFTSVLQIGVQGLLLLMAVHDKQLIHRDIKPANFAFGYNTNTLHLIDFGFCKSYIREKQHILPRPTSSLIGSMNYASINSHNCMELSRRDDLESFGYVLLYLLLPQLEWQRDKYSNDVIRDMKSNMKFDNKIFDNYFQCVRTLDFFERPNYNYLIDLFNQKN